MPLRGGRDDRQMESKQSNTLSRTGGFSVIDVLIILLVLAAIVGIVYRVVMTVSDDAAEGTVCRVYFEVSETHRDVLSELRAYDTVYLYENDMRLGMIGATMSEEGNTAPALTIVNSESGDTATATGCMVCRAVSVQDGSILVDGTGRYLTRGSVLEIRTDRVLLTVRVTDIQTNS